MSWQHFDILAFLKASKHWKEDLKRLQDELDNISYLPAGGNESGIRGSDISEPPYSIALQELKIQAEIEEIKLNITMLEYALNKLTEAERALIDGFFYPKKSIGVFVEEYGRKHGLSKTLVYDERTKVLDKLRRIIEAEYYGGAE